MNRNTPLPRPSSAQQQIVYDNHNYMNMPAFDQQQGIKVVWL